MENYSFDLTRIFLGNLPAVFYLEIVLRTVVLYLYALILLRFLGRRSAGELTSLDVLVIVALGSSVGDPMFYPDVPVLHGALVVTLIIGIERLALHWANRNVKVDRFIKGEPVKVVSDGLLELDGLKHLGVSKRELFQMARQQGYKNLGQIKRMYIETDDKPSIFEAGQARPGLQFEPPWEMAERDLIQAGTNAKQTTVAACTNCGQVAEFEQGKKVPPCPRCEKTVWSNVD
jgi:uncharacterized membrane protein YcaP (DUF421 family)